MNTEDLCEQSSANARALEEMMLTTNNVLSLDTDERREVTQMAAEIIECMQVLDSEVST